MSSSTLFKNLPIPTSSFTTTTTATLLPFLSLRPSSKPITFSSLSFKNKHIIIPCVAQTSDWAHQEEESKVVAEDEPEIGEGLEGFVAEGEDGSVEEGEEESYVEPPEDAKLFVGNLPFDVDSEKLAQLFDKAGVVEVAEVIYNRETDQSRGFGFVTMSTVEEAEKAVEMFHRYDVNGRLLTVNKAAPRGSRPEIAPREFEPSFRIYVGNLPWQVDDTRLEQVFSEHGKVVSARVVYDRESGRSRGFGFVTMASQDELDDAIAALDGQLWELVIERRLRRDAKISENQFGFMPGRSTMETIHLLRQLMEKYRDKKKDLHMVFIDLEKAHDKVPREVLWWALAKNDISRKYIDIIKDMYDGVSTSMRTNVGTTEEFPITIGVHQGSALSPFLFAIVMDLLTSSIQDDIPWCMMFPMILC